MAEVIYSGKASGVTVEFYDENHYTTYGVKPGYAVYLPHSCDDWGIAGNQLFPIDPDEALAQLGDFAYEMEQALLWMRSHMIARRERVPE